MSNDAAHLQRIASAGARGIGYLEALLASGAVPEHAKAQVRELIAQFDAATAAARTQMGGRSLREEKLDDQVRYYRGAINDMLRAQGKL